MNTDIRLSVGFWAHPKTKKTVKRLGLEGVRSLQVLWLWAAQNKPDGQLTGMDWEDIELAADWQGEEHKFFDTCLGMWVDDVDGVYALHDWGEHNPWQAEAEARAEKARKAAKSRWGNAQDKNEQPSSNASKMLNVCSSNAQASSEQCPSPLLSKDINTRGGDNTRARVDHATEPEEEESLALPVGKPARTDCPSRGTPEYRAFRQCFSVYPVQQGEEAAWREWMRLKGNGTLPESYVVYDAIVLMAGEDTRWKRGKVPRMAKWLAEKGWNDKPYIEPEEYPPRASPPASGGGSPSANTEWQKNKQEQRQMAEMILATGGVSDDLAGLVTQKIGGDERGVQGWTVPAGVAGDG